MNLDLLITYFLLIVIVALISECESKNVPCHRVKDVNEEHVISICPAPKRSRDDVCNMDNTWVDVTVNPTLNKGTARRLEIVWHVPELQLGDVIKLYKTTHIHHNNPIYEVIPYTRYGVSETQIFEKFIDIGLKFEPICMGYYVVYWRGNKALSSSCLSTNPTWMDYYKFGNMRLWDMFIPGTHDSSAYHTAYTPEEIRALDNYVFTQEESILEQLLHGARALDLRVGKDGGVYFAHHGVAQLYPFQAVLNNITLFLDRTNEVVILDFHDFPIGFHDEKDHVEFVNYIYTQLGPYMVSPALGWTATLNDIWATGKQLIVSYNHPEVSELRKDILWPPIKQMWGNVQNVSALYNYLTTVFERPPEGMWSAQSELTAKAHDIATNDLGGLRKMASDANTLVSKWFRGRWGRQCHIVAMDFIRASSIVDIAIEWNLRKSYKNTCQIDKIEEDEQKRITGEEESENRSQEQEEK